MTDFVSFGRRFSRDCFLILGGAFSLIALGSLAGNLPDIIRVGDWPASEVSETLLTASFYTVSGVFFLMAAYGFFKSTRWAAVFGMVVSAVALIFMVAAVAIVPVERADFAESLLFFAVPLLFILIWSLTEVIREFKKRQAIDVPEGHRDQTA